MDPQAHPANHHAGGVPLDERVHLERVRIFFGLAKGNMGNVALGTLLIGTVLSTGGTSVHALAVWVGLIGLCSVAVLGFERRVHRTGLTAANCTRLLQIRIALGACIALLWGVAGYLLPNVGNSLQDVFIFIILSTLVTVGALGYAAMPAYYIIINAVSLVPLTLKFAYQSLAHGDRFYPLLLAISVVWQVVVLMKARRVSQTVIQALVVNERLKDEIEEHKRTKAELQHMAQRDPLTGLANRTLFSDRLNQTLALAQRKRAHFAQLYIDLDKFKPVNDQFGHATGDLLLKAVALRILGCVRESDTVARVGGDEFVVLLREVADGSHSAMQVAEKIRAALCTPILIHEQQIEIGCCVGVAVYPEHGQNELQLSASADAAMYKAKQHGGNKTCLAEPI